nr:immunoglobulin heavy chain junction region [Mus musculus]
CVLNFDVW